MRHVRVGCRGTPSVCYRHGLPQQEKSAFMEHMYINGGIIATSTYAHLVDEDHNQIARRSNQSKGRLEDTINRDRSPYLALEERNILIPCVCDLEETTAEATNPRSTCIWHF